MRLRFLSPAETELAEAVAYYEKQVPGLGSNFLDEIVIASVMHLRRHPDHWKKRL
jgi:hypothetical protein